MKLNGTPLCFIITYTAGGNEGKKGKGVFSQITLVNFVISVSRGKKKPILFLSCCFVHVCPISVRRLNIYKIERIGCTRKADKPK